MTVFACFVALILGIGIGLWAYSARPNWVEVTPGKTIDVATSQGLTFRGQLIGFNKYQLQLTNHVVLTEQGPSPALEGRVYIPRDKIEHIGVPNK